MNHDRSTLESESQVPPQSQSLESFSVQQGESPLELSVLDYCELEESIKVSHQKLLNLLETNSILPKVSELNASAKQHIENQNVKEATIYLNEAERILEYAANRGYNIPRQVIIQVLHNEACCYQLLWNLDICSNYIEALVYNFNCWLAEKEKEGKGKGKDKDKDKEERETKYNHDKEILDIIGKKMELSRYYVQYCAINSQLKNNESALISAKKANTVLLQSLKQLTGISPKQHPLLQPATSDIIKQIASLSQIIQPKNIDSLMILTRYYLGIWKNKCSFANIRIKKIVQKFKDFSIGHFMQMQPLPAESQSSLLSHHAILEKLLLLSVSYFTIATELRLLAHKTSQRTQLEVHILPQYKQAQYYHLMSIVIISMYFPFDVVYLQHILNSFHNHFKIDLMEGQIRKEEAQGLMWVLFAKQQQSQDCSQEKEPTVGCASIQSDYRYGEYRIQNPKLRPLKSKSKKQSKLASHPAKQQSSNHQSKSKRKSKLNSKLQTQKSQLNIETLVTYRNTPQRTPLDKSPKCLSPKRPTLKKQSKSKSIKSRKVKSPTNANTCNVIDEYFRTERQSKAESKRHSYKANKSKENQPLSIYHTKNNQAKPNTTKRTNFQNIQNYKSKSKLQTKREKSQRRITSKAKIVIEKHYC